MDLVSLSLTATGLITFDTGKGPINLEASLWLSVLTGKSLVDSQTCCPILYEAPWCDGDQHASYIYWRSFGGVFGLWSMFFCTSLQGPWLTEYRPPFREPRTWVAGIHKRTGKGINQIRPKVIVYSTEMVFVILDSDTRVPS